MTRTPKPIQRWPRPTAEEVVVDLLSRHGKPASRKLVHQWLLHCYSFDRISRALGNCVMMGSIAKAKTADKTTVYVSAS